ncbi:uncharacterized protein BO66DRAFT_121610 [Aspergillus aculeatinus CBS 121060]|uniref:Uncharacterized protein n=1 Tax=Aspergillus aculeatinus CBS 121060 TaxID=1448322 RepID=A0ACD1H4Y3_9EURO|nr:hypothetical protein BO66DRAFT_121610 [Aspergillus aculeatinus CBS 121060]RAH68838.1 hypothetical protein BO66DRAFT_121610 [Aspergillus aculeatinus CBS 121060]
MVRKRAFKLPERLAYSDLPASTCTVGLPSKRRVQLHRHSGLLDRICQSASPSGDAPIREALENRPALNSSSGWLVHPAQPSAAYLFRSNRNQCRKQSLTNDSSRDPARGSHAIGRTASESKKDFSELEKVETSASPTQDRICACGVCFGFCAGGYRPTLVLPLIFDQVIWHRISGQGSAIGGQHEARHPAATGHLYSAMSLQMGKECGGGCQLRRAAQASLSGALGEHPEGRFLQIGVLCFSSTNPPASSFLK